MLKNIEKEYYKKKKRKKRKEKKKLSASVITLNEGYLSKEEKRKNS